MILAVVVAWITVSVLFAVGWGEAHRDQSRAD